MEDLEKQAKGMKSDIAEALERLKIADLQSELLSCSQIVKNWISGMIRRPPRRR